MAFGVYPTYGNTYQGGYYSPQMQPIQAAQQLPQPIQQVQQQQQITVTNGLNWIEGAEAARASAVPPNCTAVLFDTKKSVMYIKSVDQSGMPSTRTFRIEEIGDFTPNITEKSDASGVSREEIEKFENRISALEKQLQIMTMVKSKGKAKEAAEDESTV